mgnify:CR=1 FL=1
MFQAQARWFLAHRKDEDDIQIDVWCNQLKPLLTSPGWKVDVTAGRDDYDLRARAMGGWHRWCEDESCRVFSTGEEVRLFMVSYNPEV